MDRARSQLDEKGSAMSFEEEVGRRLRDRASRVEPRPDLLQVVQLASAGGQQPEVRAATVPSRAWLAGLAATAVVLLGAFGWSQLNDGSISTQVKCPTGQILSVTGDPVVDCAADYQRMNGEAPPELVAYRDMQGFVHVLMASTEVPDGYERLPGGSYQDVALIDLEYALSDFGAGLNSACMDVDAAEQIVAAEFDRLGFSGWKISVDDSEPERAVHQVLSADGTSATELVPSGRFCATHALRPDDSTVELWLSDGAVTALTNPEISELATAGQLLQDRMRSECMNFDQAMSLANELLGHLLLASDTFAGIVDEDRQCADVDLSIGGSATVRVVGPSSA